MGAETVNCRECGEAFLVRSASIPSGLFRLSRLFQRKPAPRIAYLKPCIEGCAEPREKPAVRESGRVEPFYGTEEYIPEPEGEEPLDLENFSLLEDLLNPEPEPGGEGQAQSEEEDLGSGYQMVEIEPHWPLTGSGEKPQNLSFGSIFLERSTQCFDCGAELRFSEKVSSVVCKRCSATISLEDVEIRDHRRESLKIRGNLTIHQKASLSAPEIACEVLRVYGKITGRIDCHGDAFFRSTGKVVGNFHCQHLFVHKTADLTFVPGIRAETAEIHGRVVGDLICEGTIKISKTGVVMGDCIAPAIHLESGGVLSGQMRISVPDQELRDDYDRKAAVARSEFLMRGIEEFEESARKADDAEAGPGDPEKTGDSQTEEGELSGSVPAGPVELLAEEAEEGGAGTGDEGEIEIGSPDIDQAFVAERDGQLAVDGDVDAVTLGRGGEFDDGVAGDHQGTAGKGMGADGRDGPNIGLGFDDRSSC